MIFALHIQWHCWVLFIHLNVHASLTIILIYKGQSQDGPNWYNCNAEVGKINHSLKKL